MKNLLKKMELSKSEENIRLEDIIQQLKLSGKIEYREIPGPSGWKIYDFKSRPKKGGGGTQDISLEKEEFEGLVKKAIEQGSAKTEKDFENILYSETDGSCEIYYNQYQRYFKYYGRATIKLTIKDNGTKLSVRHSGETKWSEWI